ncbi:SusC/RagA family TonB-linked outer membrane protein [Fulvivirgaceae bacterium PWU4]|uniref:SusC/RagA family TonB-linked outer membrane protein n=1 Tax=Chryseosolibacter histidini TaxID=2782349 RepID=A0AAP2DM76_9BACT|nr:SusC/RagA family TonB-linked outer membrane protein [Chryseosolibacter histidini]MBT1698870.1 SusC/RagA family TonB-linked outer membrane protein [Chryseosolibacter histidini]
MDLNFYRTKNRWKHFVFLFLALTLAGTVLAQNATVSGKVTSSDDGTALPGVNVFVKGTQNGTITDVNGNFSLSAGGDATLVFSYIGYNTQEVSVAGRSVVDITLELNTAMLSEVVVTALGIKREERSLGYAVGKVKGEDLTHVAQENVLNGLAGRLPGVSINSTGGAGSSVKMNIRGTRSLNSDNQPLFIVDGIPLNNSLNNISQVGSDNRVDYGNAISDLNPDNIESISVLKGQSAAALYGSRANNGVVIITTKNGSTARKPTVSVSSNTVFDIPYKFLDMHSKFATGILPFTPDKNPYPGGVLVIDEKSSGGMGPELDKGYNAVQWNSPKDANGNPIPTPLVSHPDNIKNFFQTGITSTNSVSLASASQLGSYRLSYTNMTNKGIIPNADLFRNSLGLNTSVKAHEKVTVSANIDFTRSNSNNRPAGNRGTNPMQWAYAVSPHIDIRELKDYWVKGMEGVQQRTQDGAVNYNNPYYMAYEVNNGFVRDRMYGNVKAEWQITPEFSFMARYGLDTYKERRETKITSGYIKERNGAYGLNELTRYERNTDFLATYKKALGQFSVTASVGGNARFTKSTDIMNKSKDGAGLVIPNLFSISNIASDKLAYSSSWGQKAVHSMYGLVNVGYKDMVYLDVTGRNDWSSTLPENNRSYFYPSVSLSTVISEMVNISDNLNLLKLRGSIAGVGNDTDPYNLYQTVQKSSDWGTVPRLNQPAGLKSPDLKPELSTAYEYGIDVAMFNNRLKFEASFYNNDTRNQVLINKIPSSSGFSSKIFNAGLVQSRGVEFALGGTPLEKGKLRWDISANYSRNRSVIKELAPGMPVFYFWEDAKGGAWTYVGDKIGDIYDAKVVTVEDKNSPYYGYPILDDNGSWQSVSAKNTKNKIGNFNPDFLMGLQTSVTYGRVTLGLSFDWRQGGEFVSQTYRYGESDFKTQRFLNTLINPGNRTEQELRDYLVANADDLIKVTNGFNVVGGPTAEYGGFPFTYGANTYPYGVFNPGVIAEYDGDGNIIGYTENLGGPGTKIIPYADNYPWDFTKAATFDASFIKLREISLSYALPSSITERLGLSAANVSIYSRNIMLWTAAKIGIDPETAFQQESTTQGGGVQMKQGIERYNVTPWVMPIGFKLGVTF